ncbi:20_t:CDS:2 [Ambispora gerdemannii]|uniref:20_t:CDS:1 n=1 Tax=Ambispora gerdemannii TaxID=144530 RepID=A0A9N9CYX9_9GLOM|nr:20_t:CDS:2 [Ambispora gerdemannii]
MANENYISMSIGSNIERVPKNIVFCSMIGGRSHVKPVLEIGRLLMKRSHNFTIVAPNARKTVKNEYPQISLYDLDPVMKEHSSESRKLYQEEFNINHLQILARQLEAHYSHVFNNLKRVALEKKADLLICDVVAQPCVDVAWTLKIPVVIFGGALGLASYKSDPMFGCHVTLEGKSFFERFRCVIIQHSQTAFYWYKSSVKYFNQERISVGIEPVSYPTERTRNSLFLANTFFGFEIAETLPPLYQEIGPIMYDSYPPLTTSLESFINSHERIIYIAFGDRFYTTPENNGKILKSVLELLTTKNLDGAIWALTQTPMTDFPSTINLQSGISINTTTILTNSNPHIKILDWAPQFAVLNHTNVKIFLTHGGIESIFEALYTATPMLIMPLYVDQYGNAEKLTMQGCALTVSKLALDEKDLFENITRLLTDHSIAQNLKRMQIFARINRLRKYRAADLIELVMYTAKHVEGAGNIPIVSEWQTADARIGVWRAENWDVWVFASISCLLLVVTAGLIGIKILKFANRWIIIRWFSRTTNRNTKEKSQ